jgi:sugar lactone lactonase YvrE
MIGPSGATGAKGSNASTVISKFMVATGNGVHSLEYSHDGISWTPTNDVFHPGDANAVAYNGKMWVAGGSVNTGYLNTLAYSYDGITWTASASGTSIFTSSCQAVAGNGSIWVAGGNGTNRLAYSYDGITWTASTSGNSIFISSQCVSCVAWNGSMWVVGSTAGTNMMAYSYDGINWTVSSSGSSFGISAYSGYHGIACSKDMWVAAGNDSPSTSILIYSYDGINWISAIVGILNNSQKTAVGWNGSMWVLMSSNNNEGGSIYYSYDGITWTESTSGTSVINYGNTAIGWNGTLWVAGGYGDSVAYSYDGITWNLSESGSTNFTWCSSVASQNPLPWGAKPYGNLQAGPRQPIASSYADYYIDTSANQLYSRSGTGWTGIMTFGTGSGSTAASGASVILGVPTNASNANNIYLDKVSGNIYTYSDTSTNIITIAGTGVNLVQGDNGPAISAGFVLLRSMLSDPYGNLYISDTTSVRKIDTSGIITNIAGTGVPEYSGDDGQAISAGLCSPWGLARDLSGNLYIADSAVSVIRKVDISGIITTIAGTGLSGYSGDDGQAISAKLNAPFGITFDLSGNLYIADSNNYRVRKIDTSGIITTIAGTGVPEYSGDGDLATSAEMKNPVSLSFDISGNLYILDSGASVIRKIDTSGIITTIAGTGVSGYSGDGGLATSAKLNCPYGFDIDISGNIYIADMGNHVIRKITASTGIITNIAGIGILGFSGDNGQATSAQLYSPFDISVDLSGNLIILDTGNYRIRKITSNGSFGKMSWNIPQYIYSTYTSETPSFWSNYPPKTLSEAIERLALAIYSIDSTPIP